MPNSDRRQRRRDAPRVDRFLGAERDALFAAILIDDEVDPQTELPEAWRLDYPQNLLIECFDLCRSLWASGYDRDALDRLASKLAHAGDLDGDDRLAFKYVRAKFKHFRYAFRLYGARSANPPLFDRMTIVMGHLQDAYRNADRRQVARQAWLLRLLLSRPAQWWIRREIARLRPKSSAEFRAMLEADRERLAAFLAPPMVRAPELHAARKIIGRQVSFYDTLRTLHPDRDSYRMSRSLSAINGLMGALHDELVARRIDEPGSYRSEPFALPRDIRDRVEALVALAPVKRQATPLA